MSADDLAIRLAGFLKWSAPGGDVRLCDGGMLQFSGESYAAWDPRFGKIVQVDGLEAGFGDVSESGTLVFAPNPDAPVNDWWRGDLFDTRVQIWMGEVDADGYTVTSARQLADFLVDGVERLQSEGGQDLLTVTLIGRAEKLFLADEGNVCSERFHRSIYPNEGGFDHATDTVGFVAWGTATPQRGSGAAGGGGSGGGSGGGGGFRSLPGLQR